MKNCFWILFFLFMQSGWAQVTQVRDTILMGSKFQITVVSENDAIATENVNAVITEIVRIENLISDWIPASQVSQVNQMAGKQPIKVDWEVFELTQRAIQYSKITQGAFDISFAAMEKIWDFNDYMDELPSDAAIKNAIAKVGYQNIILNPADTTIFLKYPGMKIGFGSIGKGYAADKGREVLKQRNVKAGIVDASGDLATLGHPLAAKYWKIGITNPTKRNKWAAVFQLHTTSVTTSGDYQKFLFIDGKRYSHIINPKTGWPSTGLTSVTVVGPSAEKANAFSTAIMVLGLDAGKFLLQKYPNYAGLFITDQGKIYKSKNLNQVLRKQKRAE
ncbi:FAD:protein FMN transferase [Flavobacterium agricola]|uniref:FAD:protein FMN transferase n=1 Tax=Flavobacterium agricola TaxID=2870839 RepID=A0ABY6M4F8_9FLAO|nr:FAD:protein FMN transferase [Flavobacterium agricola]UYW02530.1 FAD:protein FMN transferase [Flavobacterium agricola]